jgi:hypothetical protein
LYAMLFAHRLAQAVEAEVADSLAKHARLGTEDGRQRIVRHRHLPEHCGQRRPQTLLSLKTGWARHSPPPGLVPVRAVVTGVRSDRTGEAAAMTLMLRSPRNDRTGRH